MLGWLVVVTKASFKLRSVAHFKSSATPGRSGVRVDDNSSQAI